ncbi:hypothetical protein [Pedobacter agri]|uniref:hypothetical protein n=1 Tax=Pedobacter agri TaxID=454586 RepID=UPI00277EE0AF|nr:hypothetical protein [Pedobacter agri]MDQ1140113.1 hypothetical protein [Pedobacter agri]
MALRKFHEIHFSSVNQEELVYLHLHASEQRITKDYAVISTLAVTNREVRSAISNLYSKNILPIMGMVAIIEQLGEAYSRSDLPAYPENGHSSFKKALYYFGGQDADNEFTKTLYGLRNGILHNASFFSPSKGNQSNYIFTYNHDAQNVLTPPSIPWDGDFNNIEEGHFTEINPQKLLDLTQKCIEEAGNANTNGYLNITLRGGMNELIFRYFKWVKNED